MAVTGHMVLVGSVGGPPLIGQPQVADQMIRLMHSCDTPRSRATARSDSPR
jgi:hypothetical protein